jgi:nitrite reductase (cytochrome c-552)
MSTAPATSTPRRDPPAWRGWVLFVLALAATFALGVLGASVFERRQEARQRLPVREIELAKATDSAQWADNFPREYESYRRMLDSTTKTTYGGADPRDLLAETPANVVLFAGYGFALDYLQARGHTHAVTDVAKSGRLNPKTPATCWTCKSPDVPRLMGELGIKEFYAKKFSDFAAETMHPIGCYDCHEPNTMKLRITRPALREALERQGRDLAAVSHQEMRSLVCAQCHVEYYFANPGAYLTFPWDRGQACEQIEAYYDEAKFSDWEHAVSRAKMIKIQHPDYELYAAGIHAYRNVACADCHMPYRTEGGVKYTNHHIQSPLLDVANSCAVCHRWGEEEIRRRVVGIQEKVHEARARSEDALAKAHFDIAAAMEAGATDDELAAARKLVRGAQLRWDFVAAANGMGFHAPQECLRLTTATVDLAGQSRVECARILGRHGVTAAVRYPDFSDKQKAQALVKQFASPDRPKLLKKSGE